MNNGQLIGLGKFLAEMSHYLTDIENSIAELDLKVLKAYAEIDKFKKWVEATTRLNIGNNDTN